MAARQGALAIDALMIREGGRALEAVRRDDLTPRVYELRQAEGVRFFRLVAGEQGWPEVEEVTEEIASKLGEGVESGRRLRQRQADEKAFWIGGSKQEPNKGKRVKGSRGRRVGKDDLGSPTVELLARWYRKGLITEGMYRAGNRFHNEVLSAHEPCVSAKDLVRVRVDNSVKPTRKLHGATSHGSQLAVWRALEACGGIGSLLGSAVWHVVGRELSLREWCKEDGRCEDDRLVPGLLIGALEILATHYGMPPSGRGA